MERLRSTSFIVLSRRGGFWAGVIAAAVVLLAAAGGASWAAEASSSALPGVVPTPVHAAQAQERTPEANLPYLFAVFIITWAGFFGYAFLSSRRQRQMEREIETLKSALRDRGQMSSVDGG